MNCILYARVSTDKQAEKELSIPAQLQAMRDYARQQGWTVVDEFTEPGASAKTAARPQLQRLLARVGTHEVDVDVVLVHKIDRLARNVYDHAMIRASSGTSAIEIHPTDGPLMKRAFELYATGWYSIQSLSQRLGKEGLLDRNGQPIAHAHLRRLLSSSFYTGVVRWHQLECPGTHPALISRELFDHVQKVIGERYRNPGPNGSSIPGFPLRGLAICASCRGRMTGERHEKWRYYRCSRQTYRRELCSARMCNVRRAHAGIEQICRQLRISRELATDIGEAAKVLIASRVTEASLRRKHVRDEETNLLQTEMRLTDAFTGGDVAPNTYNAKIQELRAKREEIRQLDTTAPTTPEQLAEVVSRTLQLATSVWDLYEPMNEMRKATLLRNVFATIVLDHEGVAGFTLKPPFDNLMSSSGQSQPDELAKIVLDA